MKDLIYIADDDENIRKLIKMFLENDGYDVQDFETGDHLIQCFKHKPSDLVILDIMMPGTDGLSLCNQLRKSSNVPIILLTAKDSDADYVAGITLGSDDYLTKPFHPVILSMRVKALLRRTKQMTNGKNEDQDVYCDDLHLSNKKHVICCGEKEIPFTTMEYECLSYLMHHFEEAVSRKDLLNQVWGYDTMVESRVTDETIRHIRNKMAQQGSRALIQNKWGYGYILRGGENEDRT